MTNDEGGTVTLEDGGAGLFVIGGVVKSRVADGDRQVVIDHLASLLQVHNLVVLVGAGASFHLGSPKIRELSNVSVEILIRDAGGVVTATDRAILVRLNPADKGDLETLLNALQLASAFASHAGLSSVSFGEEQLASSFAIEDIRSLRLKINSALAFACRLPDEESSKEDPFAAHRTFFSKIVRGRRSNLPRPKVFTTNYDLVIERSLDELGYPYIDGFSGTVNRKLNLAYYGLDFHRVETTSQQVVARADNALYLHKIHGSLNWRSTTGKDPASGIETLEVVQVGEDESSEGSVLIYPTSAKEGDTLAYPYSDLMRLLGDAVQQPDTAIISVGYGYWDPHINRILLRALGMNPGMGVLVVDPVAVMEPDTLVEVISDPEVVGKRLCDIASLKSTPIASLASGQDSRIAVLTGASGEFTKFADLLPDSLVSGNFSAPAAVNQLIESLSMVWNATGSTDVAGPSV
ncbi:SIR2 family protein [Arthrobacter sp. ERGS1:01]|uniref:SIR2 family protein n=1 Tax=Arthrobacter sp. ERGS1:01 TaxID=1704044 RepID=UPI0009EB9C6A|nr:SIR2 family protein [Arthrobacter sp. ERGS1:01]